MKTPISGGIYLVIDPSPGLEYVKPIAEQALRGGIHVMQVWNNWQRNQDQSAFIEAICQLGHCHGVPVLINEHWQLIKSCGLDGVHFDHIPSDVDAIRRLAGKPILCGITCGNDLSRVAWANEHAMDYISFCAMFPSRSAGACEIVSTETVVQARALTALPIFLAGGITLDNVSRLSHTGNNGLVLIAAIMQSTTPAETTRAFNQHVQNTNCYATNADK